MVKTGIIKQITGMKEERFLEFVEKNGIKVRCVEEHEVGNIGTGDLNFDRLNYCLDEKSRVKRAYWG